MQNIIWQLYSDDVLLIENKNAFAEVTDKLIIYKDEYGIHTINKELKTYERVASDSVIKIDFNKSQINIRFDNNDLIYDIETSYLINGDVITLTYELGDDKKKIIIKRNDKK